ncbi:hypothetical protein FPOAC2_10702 [Fusarium poae]
MLLDVRQSIRKLVSRHCGLVLVEVFQETRSSAPRTILLQRYQNTTGDIERHDHHWPITKSCENMLKIQNRSGVDSLGSVGQVGGLGLGFSEERLIPAAGLLVAAIVTCRLFVDLDLCKL